MASGVVAGDVQARKFLLHERVLRAMDAHCMGANVSVNDYVARLVAQDLGLDPAEVVVGFEFRPPRGSWTRSKGVAVRL